MRVFEFVIALLLIGAGLTALARRIGAPYPALVALAGAALALTPLTPTLVLDPQLALTLFVAPVLLDSAFDASQRDLLENWRAVASLAIGAVAVSILSVAFVARWLVPDMSWAVAIALGAIVAPPDASAATAVLKQLRPPHRVLVVLEGESLFNDASALLVYRLALGAVAVGAVPPAHHVLPLLAFTVVGSVVLGIVLSLVILRLIGRVEDVAISITLQFCGAFAVWISAEALHLSGILTTVVFAMTASRLTQFTPARRRVPSYAVWDFAVFVLNVLAFILIGFQLKAIIARLETPTLLHYLTLAAAVCAATIVSRLVWLSGAAAVGRFRARRRADGSGGRPEETALSGRSAVVVGWCGMRGIVTLAAALGLPTGGADGPGFPYRDLVLFTAFAVVLVTLVVQGLTLRPLMNLLRLEDDGSVDREARLARAETLRAALAALTSAAEGDAITDLLRRRYTVMLERVEGQAADAEPSGNVRAEVRGRVSQSEAEIIRRATGAERQRLVALRSDGTIGDAAFQQIEQELDLEELYLQQLAPSALRG